MTMKKKILPLLLASILAAAGCADTKNMDISNSGSTSDTGSENGGSQGGGTDSSDGTGNALNNTFDDGTDGSEDTTGYGYEETYSDYSDSSLYDSGSSDYYYYDPASEIYDGSYS